MTDDNPSEDDTSAKSAKSLRIKRANYARARRLFDEKVPDREKMTVLSDNASIASISNAVDEIGINISAEYRENFINTVAVALFDYTECRSRVGNDQDQHNLISAVLSHIQELHSALNAVADHDGAKTAFDRFISLELKKWWAYENDRAKSEGDSRTDSIAAFNFVYQNLATIDSLMETLSLSITALSTFVAFLKTTSRLARADYDFVESLAEIWHYYFNVHPTLSQNEYVPKKKRAADKIKPSRQFELFLRQIVPKPKIPHDIVRSALTRYKANLGGEK